MMTSIRKPVSMIASGVLMLAAAMPMAATAGDQPLPPRAPDLAQADQPAGTVFNYLFIAGATFHPLESATAFAYSGAGCIHKTGGSGNLFAHKVVLPEGAVVHYLRLYFFDTSTEKVTAFFTTYDAAGGFNELTSVSSTNDAGGFASTLSPEISYTVDNFSAPINLVANLGAQNNNTLRFCGMRIAYVPPVLDTIFKDGFDPQPL